MLELSKIIVVIKQVLREEGCDSEVISYDEKLSDLGFDSAMVLNALAILEEQYGLDYDRLTQGIWTVKDLASLINPKEGEK